MAPTHCHLGRPSLRPVILALCCLFALPSLPHTAVATETPAPPRLEVDPPTRTLPGAVHGETVRTTFVLRNVGDAPVTLAGVMAVTDGLNVSLSTKRLLPGDEATVEFEITLGPRTLGDGRLVAVATIDDATRSRIDLVANLTVDSPVQASPPKVRWITVQGEKDGSIPVRLEAAEAFRLGAVRLPTGALRVESRPAEPAQPEEAHRAWILDLTLPADAPVGPLVGEVEIEIVGHPRQKRLFLPISGLVRPPVVVTPDRLTAPEVEIGDEPEVQEILVRGFSTAPLVIEGVRHDLAGAGEVEIREEQPGRAYRLRLTFDPETPKGPLQGRIVIETNHPLAPELVVPVSTVIR